MSACSASATDRRRGGGVGRGKPNSTAATVVDPWAYRSSEQTPECADATHSPFRGQPNSSLCSQTSSCSESSSAPTPQRPATLSQWPPTRQWQHVPTAIKQKRPPTATRDAAPVDVDEFQAPEPLDPWEQDFFSKSPIQAANDAAPSSTFGQAAFGFNGNGFVQPDEIKYDSNWGDWEEQREDPEVELRLQRKREHDLLVRQEIDRRIAAGMSAFEIDDTQVKKELGLLAKVEKEFYVEHPEQAMLTQEQVDYSRSEANNAVGEIVVTDQAKQARRLPKPVMRFEHMWHEYPEIMASIEKNGFELPTAIQREMWPVIMSGYDAIGIAQTGSGKTLAFLLPAFIHIDRQPTFVVVFLNRICIRNGFRPRSQRLGPSCIIMAPTRDLAKQIGAECKKYSYKDIQHVVIVGGDSKMGQIDLIRKKAEIVIGTPGRINDLLNTNALSLDYITYLVGPGRPHLDSVVPTVPVVPTFIIMQVLDEADKMLDFDFYIQIKDILSIARTDRTTVMTSATWPDNGKIREIAAVHMTEAVYIRIGELRLAANPDVELKIQVCRDSDKYPSLCLLLEELVEKKEKDNEDAKVLIFRRTKESVMELWRQLQKRYGKGGQAVAPMQGDMMQPERDATIRKFKEGTVWIVVATDVMSRGLDFTDITHVINYELPKDIEDFVHRVGRTGRAGRKGCSLSFVTNEIRDLKMAPGLVEVLERSKQNVPYALKQLGERGRKENAERAVRQRQNKERYGRRNNDAMYEPYGDMMGSAPGAVSPEEYFNSAG